MKENIKVIIEIPKGTENKKYEYDEKSGVFKLDFVFENIIWPYNYGFIPGTQAGDGDTLDAIVLSTLPLKQGQEAECKVIGVMDVLDRGVEDNKIICVPAHRALSEAESVDDLLGASIDDIVDVSEEQKKEWTKFLLELARQKKKITEVRGFGNKKEALGLLQKSFIS